MQNANKKSVFFIDQYTSCGLLILFILATANVAQAETATDDKAELRVNANDYLTPSSNANGGSGYGIDTTILSAPIDGSWRLYAGEYFAHEIEPAGEGTIGYSRATAGIAYQGDSVAADFAPTYNHHNSTERVGAVGDVTWNIDSAWAVGGGGQLFSRDTPLRAMNAGITSDSYDLNAAFHQDDARDVRVEFDIMNFSDNNFRTDVSATDTEHLFSNSYFSFDGLVNAIESNDSKNEDRLYFNPEQDFLGKIGGRITQPLYHSDGYVYDHSVTIMPGVYWQQNYGSSVAVEARYDQSLHVGNDLDLGFGVDVTRQAADGVEENSYTFLLNVAKRI